MCAKVSLTLGVLEVTETALTATLMPFLLTIKAEAAAVLVFKFALYVSSIWLWVFSTAAEVSFGTKDAAFVTATSVND